MSALPFRATTPQQAPQHQANGRLSAETLCHANRRSSPSAPSLFAMRRSISNQAESSQHHTFEWLNEQSPVGKKQMLVDPRHKTSQGQKGGFFVQCLNWATPSHKVIATGQKEYLAPLTPTLLPFLSPKQLITSNMHRVRSILFQSLTKTTPDRSTQVLQSHLLHPFPHFYSIHLQNCPHMQHVSFIKYLCLHCLWGTLPTLHTWSFYSIEKWKAGIKSLVHLPNQNQIPSRAHIYQKQQKGGSGTQKKQDRTRS